MISPLLANVYLHELDEFMERLVQDYSRGTKRAGEPRVHPDGEPAADGALPARPPAVGR